MSFEINDKRVAARAQAAGGVPLGNAGRRVDLGKRTVADLSGALGRGRNEDEVAKEVRLQRRALARRTAASSGGGATINMATGRPKDPMYYWQQNNVIFDVRKAEDQEKIRAFMRMLYMTHPVFASATDIFSKYPLLGMELSCKDPELTDFYNELFFEQLDYEEYLVDVGREYWTVGEAWPYGSFNEDLGVWEDDELLNPDDIEVHRTPFSKEPFFTMRLPQSIRDVLTKRDPQWEYARLVRDYPELLQYQDERKRMPVSNVLLKQLKFKGDTFNPRGVPIGMRAIRAITQEEMMMSAQDAVADRLYTPLILARLGATANDLGTPEPWIPLEDELADFEEALDAALAGDFRLMVTHFAVQVETVFGREQMPNLTMDFERLTERILQTWGLSQTMLSGAGSGETYAADALNRDLITQLLSTYQKRLVRLYKDRALVVAEAQGHYDTETRNGRRYPIMEEVFVIDEESGEGRIEEQPKLLIPDLHMRTMNMQSETMEHEFYEALRAAGVPISMKTRLRNTPISLDDEMEQTSDEQVEAVIEDLKTKKKTYLRLLQENLPVPPELKELFDPHVSNKGEIEQAASGGLMSPGGSDFRMPQMGVDDPITPSLAPTPQMLSIPPGIPLSVEGQDPTDMADGQGGAMMPLPRNRGLEMMQRQRPPESDEQRQGMPRASKFDAPRHLGARRYANLDKDTPIEEERSDAS